MMRHLGDRRRQSRGGVPGAEIAVVEAHAAGCDVEESSHHDARVRPPVDPLVLRQARDAMDDEAIVRPAGEFHHRIEIGRRCDRIKEADRRETGWDQSIARDRSVGVGVCHEKTMSVSAYGVKFRSASFGCI